MSPSHAFCARASAVRMWQRVGGGTVTLNSVMGSCAISRGYPHPQGHSTSVRYSSSARNHARSVSSHSTSGVEAVSRPASSYS